MHYVKHFDINGVATRLIPCIELQGAPNAATEGAVGVLAMDMTSLTHDIYKCVAVNGSVYTWELLSAGMSILSAKVSGEGVLTVTFAYSNLLMPNRYIVKPGDLIIDSKGYLYQIETIGADSCVAKYGNTRIGGIVSGDNDRKLMVKDNKLMLTTEGGQVLSEVAISELGFKEGEITWQGEVTLNSVNSSPKLTTHGRLVVGSIWVDSVIGMVEPEGGSSSFFGERKIGTLPEGFCPATEKDIGYLIEGNIVGEKSVYTLLAKQNGDIILSMCSVDDLGFCRLVFAYDLN